MYRSIVLLRGINLGKRQLKMDRLRELCHQIGATDVLTYIQSGNVVLRHPSLFGEALEVVLCQTISEGTGMDVPVIVRSVDELEDLVAHNPFPDSEGTKLVVWFLARRGDSELVEVFDAAPFAPERMVVHGRDVYLSLPEGQARSALLAALSKVRPVIGYTARNWNTVVKLAATAQE